MVIEHADAGDQAADEILARAMLRFARRCSRQGASRATIVLVTSDGGFARRVTQLKSEHPALEVSVALLQRTAPLALRAAVDVVGSWPDFAHPDSQMELVHVDADVDDAHAQGSWAVEVEPDDPACSACGRSFASGRSALLQHKRATGHRVTRLRLVSAC